MAVGRPKAKITVAQLRKARERAAAREKLALEKQATPSIAPLTGAPRLYQPPPARWKLTMVPGVTFNLVDAPNRFHRWALGLVFGFRWERLSLVAGAVTAAGNGEIDASFPSIK